MGPFDDLAGFGHFHRDDRIKLLILLDGSYFAAHKFHSHRLGILIELLVALTEGADVHVVNGNIRQR